MSKEDKEKERAYRTAESQLIYLLRCAVNEEIPRRDKLSGIDVDIILHMARRHMVTAAVSMALESAGICTEQTAVAIGTAIRKAAIFKKALSEVEDELEQSGIWYMPLKGIIMQSFFPKIGMREMADHDILINSARADDVKRIMEKLGFITQSFDKGNHDVYHKMPCLNFEMHRALFGSSCEKKIYQYYLDIEKKLIKGKGNKLSFTDEDFYIYMIAHEFKHYSASGTGVRSLLDTYVYLHCADPDMGYIEEEVEKLGISGFEKANRLLAENLFGTGNLIESDMEKADYYFSSGTYGTITNRVANTMQKNSWSKMQYMLHRFFEPFAKINKENNAFAAHYPLFYRYRIILPLLPFYRVINSIRSGRFIAEAKAIRDADTERMKHHDK